MADTNDRLIATLNNLVQVAKDGEEGFRTAAGGLRTPELKNLFLTYAQQRAEFAAELQAEIRRLGGDPERGGSIAGAAHRGWINIKSVMTGGSDASILSEAERGEDVAKAAYESALKEPLPPDVRSIVERQYSRIQEAHDRIRVLRDRAA